MTRRRALIGFTEAELGFVIAAVVAFTATAEMHAEKTPAQTARPAPLIVPETVFVERPAAIVAADTPVVADKVRDQWASNRFRRGCAEVEGKGLARVPIGMIEVDGVNRYRIGDRSLSLRDLEQVLAPLDSEAKANMCRYTLLFRPNANVGANELLRAEEPFAGRFYREHRLR